MCVRARVQILCNCTMSADGSNDSRLSSIVCLITLASHVSCCTFLYGMCHMYRGHWSLVLSADRVAMSVWKFLHKGQKCVGIPQQWFCNLPAVGTSAVQ